ncbi:MAG TPA: hypothetical protein VGJ88_09000 [Thermoanaerobaculia bacterium]
MIESEPFVVTGELPEGWTVDEGRVVPPEATRSACRVSRTLFHDREWKTVVAAALRNSTPAWRELKKISGHEAAEYRTTTGSRSVDTVYINLDSIEPMGVSIWRVEADNDAPGWQCEREFAALVHTLRIDVDDRGTR